MADRPRRRSRWYGARRLSRRGRLPRLPPPTPPITIASGATTAAPYDHDARAAPQAAPTPRFRRAGCAAGSPAAGCACARWTPSCSATGGMRVSHWLGAVIDESERQGLTLTTLDDALTRHEPTPAPADLAVSSWGEGGDLRTWSGPAVADLAWRRATAELRAGRARGPAAASAPCASCWRCRRATGRSWPPRPGRRLSRERARAHAPDCRGRSMRRAEPADRTRSHGLELPAGRAGAWHRCGSGPVSGASRPLRPATARSRRSAPAKRLGRLAHADHPRRDAARRRRWPGRRR